MPASPSSDAEPVVVRAVPIELCQFLKFAGLAESGGEAKHFIVQGRVEVNGVVEIRKTRQLAAGDRVTLGTESRLVALS